MREYSLVLPAFWIGETGRALRAHPAEVRELACYLFSCPGNEMYGLYYKPIESIVAETGRCKRTIKQGLATLNALGFAVYDEAGEWVWVVEMAQIQMGLPLLPKDYKVTAANKWYQRMPKNVHLGPYFDRYCDSLHLAPPRRSFSPTETVSTWEQRDLEGAVVSPVQPLISISNSESSTGTQSRVLPDVQGAESGNGSHGRSRLPATLLFERFWNAYPKHVGRKAARDAWDHLKPNETLTETIVAAVERHKTSLRWIKDGGQYIPDPQRYLKHERWNDHLSEGPMLTKQTLSNVDGPLGSFFDGFKEPHD